MCIDKYVFLLNWSLNSCNSFLTCTRLYTILRHVMWHFLASNFLGVCSLTQSKAFPSFAWFTLSGILSHTKNIHHVTHCFLPFFTQQKNTSPHSSIPFTQHPPLLSFSSPLLLLLLSSPPFSPLLHYPFLFSSTVFSSLLISIPSEQLSSCGSRLCSR